MKEEMLEKWCKEMKENVGKHRDDCKGKKYYQGSYDYFRGYIQSLEDIESLFLR